LIAFDRVVGILLGHVQRGWQFVEHPQVGPALSVVTPTGAGPCRRARVKNRRAAAVSRCSDRSTSMTWPYRSTARYMYRQVPVTLT
jgi:hypothetical protein